MSNKKNQAEPQSQSIPGPTADNPNEDVADGNQSTIQPGTGDGGTPTPAPGQPSTGGNPAAADGGNNSSYGGNQ